MIIPIAIAGVAALWYFGKEDAPESDSIEDYLIDKPSNWSEIPTVPKSVVSKNVKLLKSLNTYEPDQVWGEMPDWPMEDFSPRFRQPKKMYLIKAKDYVYLVDGRAAESYMRKVCKIKRK